jgi:hypothetical protein
MTQLRYNGETPISALVGTYEVDYSIDDPALYEPFDVLKTATWQEGTAWWNGPSGRQKVEALINGLKMDFLIKESCIFAGISLYQYKYFCQVHPKFRIVKDRCKSLVAITAKRGLVGDIKSKDGSKSRQWYLERRQPGVYGRTQEVKVPTQTMGTLSIIKRAFLDNEGKTLISESTASMITHNDANNGS